MVTGGTPQGGGLLGRRVLHLPPGAFDVTHQGQESNLIEGEQQQWCFVQHQAPACFPAEAYTEV